MTGLATDMVSSFKERRGTPVPVAGEQKFPARDTFAPDGAKGLVTRVAAREKEKALGPCELRALLHDAPSSTCTRHGRRCITGHRRTLRSDNASYARALDRAHNLLSPIATRSESLPITSRAGNDRNASPGELDFMYRGMTRGMKAHVSTMLTESDLSIPLPLRHFKGLVRRNG